jgi:hypothetical protein
MNDNSPIARTSLSTAIGIFAILAGTALIARATDVPTPINVSVCDLVRRPLDFKNKHIRVQGKARFVFEVRALVDENCPADNRIAGMIWLDFGDPDNILKYFSGWTTRDYFLALKAGEVKGEETSVSWQTASAISPMEPGKISEFYKAFKKKSGAKANKDVLVTIIGRFDFTEKGLLIYTQDKGLTFKPGFGHMGRYSGRIAIESIELVKKGNRHRGQ